MGGCDSPDESKMYIWTIYVLWFWLCKIGDISNYRMRDEYSLDFTEEEDTWGS